MPVPISQMATVATYVLEAEAARAQALPARADARAALPLQPGLRRLREDPVPGEHPEVAAQLRGVHAGGGRVPGADGEPAGRRAADAPRDRPHRGGARRAQEVHLPVHQRAAARREARPLHAVEVPELQRAPRRSRRRARRVGVPRRHLRQGGARDREGARARLPRHHQHDALRRRRSGARPRTSSTPRCGSASRA